MATDKELRNLADSCFFDLEERRNAYEEYRSYYHSGSGSSERQASVNKIYGEINNFLSLIYSPDNMILEPVADKTVELTDLEKDILSTIYEKVRANIFEERNELKLSRMILGALIDGISIGKILWNEKSRSCSLLYIKPSNFGVMFEDRELQDEYQVFCHKTELTEKELENKYPEIAKKIKNKQTQTAEISRAAEIINGSLSSSALVLSDGGKREFKPRAGQNVYEARELWYYENSSWMRTLIIENIIVDTKEMPDNPFFVIRPIEMPSYFWGMPIIYQIKPIQDNRMAALALLGEAVTLQTKPPLTVSGYGVSYEEANLYKDNLGEPNGICFIPGSMNGSTKIEPYIPGINISALFQLLEYYDMQTQYITGINEIMMGEAQKNVRSQGYAHMLAEFASTELKRTAHTIEGQLEEVFTTMAYFYQINDKTRYAKNGNSYLLIQFSHEYRIEIYAHSGSPISMESNAKIAFELLKMGLMPPEELIKILPLPDKDKITDYIRKQEKEKQIAAQVQAQHPQPEQKEKKK